MNKLKQGILASAIATTSLFVQVNDAIAKTLSKENEKNKTEMSAKIIDNTTNAISINFNEIENSNLFISSRSLDWTQNKPWNDIKEIKDSIMNNDSLFISFENIDQAKKDFDLIWNQASQSDVWHIYEPYIIRIFTWAAYKNEDKVMFLVSILDPEGTTQLWQQCKEMVQTKSQYIFLSSKINECIQWDIKSLATQNEKKKLNDEKKKLDDEKKKLDDEWKMLDIKIEQAKEEWIKLKEEWIKLDENIEKLKKEWEQLKKEWEQLKKDGEKLRSINQSLDEMKKTFEEHQKKE